MTDRNERLKAIRKLLRTHRVSSQDELLKLLDAEGFALTQATLSRDLKALKVGKVSAGKSGYFYTVPSEEERRESEKSYALDLRRGFVSIDWNDAVVVIKTLTGHGGAVGLAIDNLAFESTIGSVSGDDAVFAALRRGSTGEDFARELLERVPELDLELDLPPIPAPAPAPAE